MVVAHVIVSALDQLIGFLSFVDLGQGIGDLDSGLTINIEQTRI